MNVSNKDVKDIYLFIILWHVRKSKREKLRTEC